MYIRSQTVKIGHTYTFWVLVALIAATILLYGYFVNVTILYTAERQVVEEAIVDTKTHISQLELALIDSHRNLTKEYAYDMGFSSVNELVFVERNARTSLSLNEL